MSFISNGAQKGSESQDAHVHHQRLRAKKNIYISVTFCPSFPVECVLYMSDWAYCKGSGLTGAQTQLRGWERTVDCWLPVLRGCFGEFCNKTAQQLFPFS